MQNPSRVRPVVFPSKAVARASPWRRAVTAPAERPARPPPARPRRTVPLLALWLCAALPVAYIAARAADASRNIVFWDEFDSVLGFLLRLDSGLGLGEFLGQLAALNSEHRTVTSRLLFALSYGLTGGVNFEVIGLLGNLCLLGLCAVLLASVGTPERRVRLAVLLSFGVFHLELYEPLFWSGASIDHFQVLLLAGGALAALASNGRTALLGAALLAILASLTLAHGTVVWPVGAAMLGRGQRWRAFTAWGGIAVLTLAVFFSSYEVNSAHRFTDVSAAGAGQLVSYWLALLGGPLTFGDRGISPVFGLGLLLGVGWLVARGAWEREPVVVPVALFAIGSLALVAFGRVNVAGPQIESRYLTLGALAWALAGYLVVERGTNPVQPYRLLVWCLPLLAGFNLAANRGAAARAETFLYSRDYPAIRFKLYGQEGRAGQFRLHPSEGRAEQILAQAAARGLYDLPSFSAQKDFVLGLPSSRLITYVTNLTANERAVGFEGWAMLPARRSHRNEIHVVLRSTRSELVFSTMSVARPDVARALKEPLWHHCGYSFVVPRAQLPEEDFQIGLLVANGDFTAYTMTEHWLRLAGPR